MTELAGRERVADAPPPAGAAALQVVLSFDVEEHWRIEAAADLAVAPDLRAHHAARVEPATRWLLDLLAGLDIRATFFVLGELARDRPQLVRALHAAGHEVASHGWDHRRVHHFDPASFREEVRRSKDTLEQITGAAVVGYRAPTFSVMRRTAWALDVLAELGLAYDSSIYPVHHDRYGVPEAPRWPFRARGGCHSILELPPATGRLLGVNVPLGGGGYFRLLPLGLMAWALRQTAREGRPPVAVLYFHPWEFDPQQRRLPLPWLRRWRTYAGIGRARGRLRTLLGRHRFSRAADVAQALTHTALPTFDLAAGRWSAPT